MFLTGPTDGSRYTPELNFHLARSPLEWTPLICYRTQKSIKIWPTLTSSKRDQARINQNPANFYKYFRGLKINPNPANFYKCHLSFYLVINNQIIYGLPIQLRKCEESKNATQILSAINVDKSGNIENAEFPRLMIM